MIKINTLIKQSDRVLFSDSELFNKDITGVKSLNDIKDIIGIKGELKRVNYYGRHMTYRLINSNYEFTLTFLD